MLSDRMPLVYNAYFDYLNGFWRLLLSGMWRLIYQYTNFSGESPSSFRFDSDNERNQFLCNAGTYRAFHNVLRDYKHL